MENVKTIANSTILYLIVRNQEVKIINFLQFLHYRIPTDETASYIVLLNSAPQAESCRLDPWCKKSSW